MKKTIVTIILSLIYIGINAQVTNCLWAENAGGTGLDRVSRITTDASGNVYVTGFYSSPSIVFGATTLFNSGGNDFYLVKYDALGNVLWVNGAGGSGTEISENISIDNSGNVYITGHYSSPIISFGTITISNFGASDIFVVKYDSSGNVLWAKGEGNTGFDYGKSATIDASGNLYITGQYDSPSITFGTFTLTNAGGSDIFITKYDPMGNVLWAKGEGSTSWDYAHNTATDVYGNIYLTGYYASPTVTFGAFTLTNTGIYDIYIVKYDSLGNVIWAKSEGSTGDDEVWSTTTDASGNLYITGFYNSPSITFGTTTINNIGNEDVFIVKYDSFGNVIWAKSAGSIGNDESWGCTTDVSGNVYVTGSYFYSISFEATTLTNPDNTGTTSDMFLVKYDASGNLLWAMGSGNTGDDFPNNPAADAAGNVYVSGSYNYSSMNFGACTLTTEGGYDIFIVKIKDNCFAYYTSSYDSTLNTFNITIDSSTSSIATGYHWDFGDGTTSTLAAPSHTYTIDSLYNVCMKIYTASGDSCSYCHTIGIDTLGNIVRSTGFNLNVNPTNTTNIIQNELAETAIKFSPNPFNSQTTILADRYLKNVTLTLYNSMGQQVKQVKNISGRTIELKRDNLVSGLYFMKITQGNEIISADRLLITD